MLHHEGRSVRSPFALVCYYLFGGLEFEFEFEVNQLCSFVYPRCAFFGFLVVKRFDLSDCLAVFSRQGGVFCMAIGAVAVCHPLFVVLSAINS